MADGVYANQGSIAQPYWGAIWSGTFSFLAIETVFGLLGAAIFPRVVNPGSGIVGISIWMVILTIIAMYVGGRVAGEISGAATSLGGAVTGTIMFGLSTAGLLVLAALVAGYSGVAGATDAAHNLIGLLARLGWEGFFAAFLGWLAAMGGAASAVSHVVSRPLQEARHVA